MLTSFSTTLESYLTQVPKPAAKALSRHDELSRTMKLIGKEPPTVVRLFKGDYDAIDRMLRKETQGQLGVEGTTWRGLKLTHTGE